MDYGCKMKTGMMRSKWAAPILISAVLVLNGCASMSADECAVSDWRAIGFEDGVQGYNSSRLGTHRKACAKHGVAPNFEAYQSGRQQGLREFCQPSRGFNVGASGTRYNGVCPVDMEPEFVTAYNSGHRLYNLRSSVNATTRNIDSRRAELERIEDRTVVAGVELVAQETTTENRILLLAELKDMSERSGQLEAEIVTLIEERVLYEQQLAEYEAMIADARY